MNRPLTIVVAAVFFAASMLVWPSAQQGPATISGAAGASGTGTCTNQFVTATNAGAAPTCTTATLASAQFANQGTATTILHGNAAGNPTFAAVNLTAGADITGTLPIANGGTGATSLSWANQPFDAGNYTGSVNMTWTVAAGDVLANRYLVIGKLLFWNVELQFTTVGGTPTNQLQILLPNSLTMAANPGFNCSINFIQDNGATAVSGVGAKISNTQMGLFRFDLAAWTAATDTTQINFMCFFEID